MSGLVESSADARSKTIGQNFRVRAWVNVSATTILGSGNVSSVNISGSNYIVNFTSTLPNDDYAVVATASTSAFNNVVQRASSTNKTDSNCTLSILEVNAGNYDTSDKLQVVCVG